MNRKLFPVFLLLLLLLAPVRPARADTAVFESYMLLVNKHWHLPSDYEPSDLSGVNVPFAPGVIESRKQMRADAARALEAMFTAAKEDGIELLGISGYRSYATQNAIYWRRMEEAGAAHVSRYIAEPGASEHQSGLAMDLGCPGCTDLTERFASTDAYAWITKNAHRFGFIIRYTEQGEPETGYAFEPWHVRYVGNEAPAIYRSGLTLEAYIQRRLVSLDISPILPRLYEREA